MGERWVLIELVEDDSLRCHSCYERVHNQKVYLYIDVNNEIEEVMCDTCWKEKQKEMFT